MPRFSNGRLPDNVLAILDTGGGRHLTTLMSAARWYLLRRNVKLRTGVTLYISPGMNAYRDWAEQGVGRANACAAGNCNAAASQGWSSHGGTWNSARWTGGQWVDAMAFDIGNYWQIPWAIFVEECQRVGLRTGLITADVAGIEEPWHVIDLAPYDTLPVRMVYGADGIWRLDETSIPTELNPYGGLFDMLTDTEQRQIYDLIAGKNQIDLAGVFADRFWNSQLQAQDATGRALYYTDATKKTQTTAVTKFPVTYTAWGYLTSTNAQLGAVREALKLVATGQGADPQAILEAAEKGAQKALKNLTLTVLESPKA